MNCIDVQNLLSAYIDGECSNNEKRIIEEHLKQCSDCIEEYRLLKTLIGDLNNIEEIDLPDGFHNDLMDKIKSSTPMVEKKKSRSIKRWYSATAAAFLFIIIFGVIGTATLTRWINYSKDEVIYDAVEETKMEESTDRELVDIAPKTSSIEQESDMISLEESMNEDSEEEIIVSGSESLTKEEFSAQAPSNDTTYTTVTEDNLTDSGESIDRNKIDDHDEKNRIVDENLTNTMDGEMTRVDEELEVRTNNQRLPLKNFAVIIVIVLLVISIPIIIIIYSVSKRTKK